MMYYKMPGDTSSEKFHKKKNIRLLKTHLGYGEKACVGQGERKWQHAPADVLAQLAAHPGKTRRANYAHLATSKHASLSRFVRHACNPRALEAETRGARVQG